MSCPLATIINLTTFRLSLAFFMPRIRRAHNDNSTLALSLVETDVNRKALLQEEIG